VKLTPSIVTRATPGSLRRAVAPVIETLENRQLLSLTVDLRLPGGAKSANVSSVGQVINLEIWATAKGSDSSGANEALQIVVGSLLSTNVNGGAANGTLKATTAPDFSFAGPKKNGMQADLDADGDLDIGSNDPTDADPFFAARDSSLNSSGLVSGNSQSWKIGTATFTVTSLKSTTGQTNLLFRGRTANQAWTSGLWQEDDKIPLKTAVTSSYLNGSPLVLTRGNTPPPPTGASIAGNVFKDLNKNNVKDGSDTGFGSVTMFLDSNKNGIKDSTEKTATTDSSGNYKFAGLSAGSYRVREVVPSGFKVSSPSTGFTDVTVTTNQAVTGKNFADQPTTVATTGTISGKVFNDTDGDGVLDTGETGRSSVRVFLDKDKDGIFDSTEPNKLTDSSGNYSFAGIANGSYRVRVVKPSGFRISTPSAGYYDVSVSGNTSSGKNFGLTQKILISGRAWVDSDNDGVKDSTEAVLANWRVFIDKDKDGVFDAGETSTLTDSSGNYSFKGLAAGSYRVRIVQQSGFTRLAPSTGFYDITLSNGGTSTGKNFRFKKP
jgi:uncharacterized protein (DUF2141 family)